MNLILAAVLAAASPTCPTDATAPAFVCRALAAERVGRHADGAEAFEKAAAATPSSDPAQARMFAAAGNLWISAGHPGKAALALDKALAGKRLDGVQHGLALLDRARAAEAQADFKTARAKVTEAARTISEDPYLWFFSAALAVREGDIPTAKAAINRALALAPDSPEVMFEAGHIAKAAGEDAKARDYWTSAAAADPKGPAGRAARAALALMEVPLTVTGQIAARPEGDGEGPKDQ
ncbi:MAG: tetratricopeptide repeat protein [Sphingomicrobium sp.]